MTAPIEDAFERHEPGLEHEHLGHAAGSEPEGAQHAHLAAAFPHGADHDDADAGDADEQADADELLQEREEAAAHRELRARGPPWRDGTLRATVQQARRSARRLTPRSISDSM